MCYFAPLDIDSCTELFFSVYSEYTKGNVDKFWLFRPFPGPSIAPGVSFAVLECVASVVRVCYPPEWAGHNTKGLTFIPFMNIFKF